MNIGKKADFALKGTIVHTPTPHAFEIIEKGYLLCNDGKVSGLLHSLPSALSGIRIFDYSDKIIVPGMCDMHLHAPQYGFRGMGMDLGRDGNWHTWFETYSLPEERRYKDIEYAKNAYTKFVHDLLYTTTTRICVYATIHREATELLMSILAENGFAAYVGKLNMDRNSIEGLIETTEESISETKQWLINTADRYKLVKPMITPRYIPSCSDACMEGLQLLKDEFKVPVQSHLSENYEEIEWVKSLKPEIGFYAEAYDMYGMLGSDVPSVMAHCIFPEDEEFQLMTQREYLWVAHCPQSNLHSCGSAAPIRKYLNAGIKVGLGSDMAGANTLNLFRAISDCSIASRVYWAANDRSPNVSDNKTYFSLSEAFYLATKGGGSLWGEMGSFEENYLFDAVVIDDSDLQDFVKRTSEQRVERIISRSDDRHVVAKFIEGTKVL